MIEEAVLIYLPIDKDAYINDMEFNKPSHISLLHVNNIVEEEPALVEGFYKINFTNSGNTWIKDIVATKPDVIDTNYIYLDCKFHKSTFVLKEYFFQFRHTLMESVNLDTIYLGLRVNNNGTYFFEGLYDDNREILLK